MYATSWWITHVCSSASYSFSLSPPLCVCMCVHTHILTHTNTVIIYRLDQSHTWLWACLGGAGNVTAWPAGCPNSVHHPATPPEPGITPLRRNMSTREGGGHENMWVVLPSGALLLPAPIAHVTPNYTLPPLLSWALSTADLTQYESFNPLWGPNLYSPMWPELCCGCVQRAQASEHHPGMPGAQNRMQIYKTPFFKNIYILTFYDPTV